MSKSFDEAFEAWKQDHSYEISEDIGWEYSDVFECPGPTPEDRSLTLENGSAHTEQKIVDRGQTA